jgi:hypothetical protein
VHAKTVTRAALISVVVGLLVCAGILLAAGLHENAQITDLKDHGVDVTVTFTGCIGQLGGSGSNAAGYVCRGSYRYQAVTYNRVIPGSIRRAPGSTAQVVIASDNPTLVSTTTALAAAQASDRVLIIPALLTVAALALGTVTLRRARRHTTSARTPSGNAQAGGV